MKLSDLVDRHNSAINRDKSMRHDVRLRHDLRIYRITLASTKWGADAMARSNYAALKAEFEDCPWCVVDPEDGPLYVPGHLTASGQGEYDDTPPWDDCFDRAAIVFFDGDVYVNLDYEFKDDPNDQSAQELHDLADMLDSLDGYPIIDDEAFSALEYNEALESLKGTAKYYLPEEIKAQHEYGDKALELDPDFKITVDDIVSACCELDIDWENEAASDGSNYAYIRDEDMKRIVKYLTPFWFLAAANGLEWADLGYPLPNEDAPPSLPYPDPEDKETARNWWIKE